MEKYKFQHQAAILIISDKVIQGQRSDTVGSVIALALANAGIEVVIQEIEPDEVARIAAALIRYSDEMHLSLIITSGGTGLSPRDVTPEATASVSERIVPGFAEAMRAEGQKYTPHAMLSRSLAVIRGSTLIINLPGSPKGALESLNVILPALTHGLDKLKGDTQDCATK